MLSSTAIEQPKLGGNIKHTSTTNQNLLKPFKTSLSLKPKSFSSSFNLRIDNINNARNIQKLSLRASSTSIDPIPTDDLDFQTPTRTQKLKVVVKSLGKPRLVLKFIWMQKDIGVALDQSIPGHGTIPLSPYYFWPRKDAWEELKVLLESKPWISPMQKVILLNQATDIINLWQASGGNI